VRPVAGSGGASGAQRGTQQGGELLHLLQGDALEADEGLWGRSMSKRLDMGVRSPRLPNPTVTGGDHQDRPPPAQVPDQGSCDYG
jgi:hypothetical protein